MKMKTAVFISVGLFLLTELASARPLGIIITPQELSDKADVVFTGAVLQVKETGLKSEKKLGQNEPIPTKQYKALIQVEQVEKGSPSGKISLLYFSVDWDKLGTALTDGPWEIYLSEGKRYKFYLKRSSSDAENYLSVLDGEFDDGSAVEEVKQ